MQTRLRLFLDWGIRFEEAYQVPERDNKRVVYAGRKELVKKITERYPSEKSQKNTIKDEREVYESESGVKTYVYHSSDCASFVSQC